MARSGPVLDYKEEKEMAAYYIGEHGFSSKSAAKRFLSELKDQYDDGQRVSDEFRNLLTALLEMHEDQNEKIGKGIEYFIVDNNADLFKATRGYRVKQVGNPIPVAFSYTKIIDRPSVKQQVQQALQNAIADLMREYRRKAFEVVPVYCADTGREISIINEAQVIHRNPSWGSLTTEFVNAHGGWEAIALNKSPRVTGHVLASDQLKAEWRALQKRHLEGLAITLIPTFR